MPPTIPESVHVSDFVVNQGHGVTGLVERGLHSLPQQYIQPPEETFDGSSGSSEESIPIIDVSDWDDPKVTESICQAASKWGFFQIINHGVPLEVLNDLQDAAHKFFESPSEERRKYFKGNSPTDTVFLATSFSSHKEAVLEWEDYLSFHYVAGDNTSSLWPPVIKDQVVAYMKRAQSVIKRVLQVLLKKLNVNEIDKEREYSLRGSLRINFNYYPPCPNPEAVAGIVRHSDISTITVLLQDEVGGLYVRAVDGHSWIHVPPITGALVINVGDILQIMSNDRYRGIEHRVVVNRSKSRVSVPIFVNPGPDAVVGPLAEALDRGEKLFCKEIMYSDYFQYFFSMGHDGKNTIDFAKI